MQLKWFTWLFTAVLSVSPVYSTVSAATNARPDPLEVTKVDLFASPTWTSRDISVGGLMLSMTKQEVAKLAKLKGYKIFDTLGQQKECAENRCDVFSKRNRPLGVSIIYGNDGTLKEIDVDSFRQYSEYGGSGWSADVLARKLHGLSYQLVNNYSEALCRRLLGQETRREQSAGGVIEAFELRSVVLYYKSESNGTEKLLSDVTLGFVRPPIQR